MSGIRILFPCPPLCVLAGWTPWLDPGCWTPPWLFFARGRSLKFDPRTVEQSAGYASSLPFFVLQILEICTEIIGVIRCSPLPDGSIPLLWVQINRSTRFWQVTDPIRNRILPQRRFATHRSPQEISPIDFLLATL